MLGLDADRRPAGPDDCDLDATQQILSVIIEVFMARLLSLADLSDDVVRFAEAQLASGEFSTVEDVIRAGAEALR